MGGAHAGLFTGAGPGAGGSPIHRLAPESKVAATFLFVLAVVSTPREAIWAFALDGLLIAIVAVVAGLRVADVLRRLVIEVPFLAFALFLPIVGQGERVEVLGMSLSVAGLWGAWNIVVKGTLGVAASVVLASTTSVPELLRGLDRLHLPKVLTGIMGFMLRYSDVIVGEMHRMRVARIARGHDPRWIWQVKAVASSAGALFVRSFERGERVHLAMLARGYTGTLPVLGDETGAARSWPIALALPAAATVIAMAAWTVR
jgi:cobalt/nickel transport system permease protein